MVPVIVVAAIEIGVVVIAVVVSAPSYRLSRGSIHASLRAPDADNLAVDFSTMVLTHRFAAS
jgi:hypothetical protein